MIWFSGQSGISIVDMTNLSAQEITGLVPYSSQSESPSIVMRCVARENGARIVLLFLNNEGYHFAYCIRGKSKPIYHKSEQVLPNSKKMSTYLSFTSEKNYLHGT